MKLFSTSRHILGVMLALLIVGCVDESYRVDQVSTEVTLLQGTTVLPLGKLEKLTVADMLGDEDLDGMLVRDQEGNFSINYSGDSSSFELENVMTEFTIPELSQGFDVDCQVVELTNAEVIYDDVAYVNLALDGFSSGALEFTEGYVPLGDHSINFTGGFEASLATAMIDIALPDQIDDVNHIYFNDIDEGHPGAPVHFQMDLNGLKEINGGGDLNVKFTLKGGVFKIYDAYGKYVEGDVFEQTLEIEEGVDHVDFVIYVESLTPSNVIDDKHHLSIPLGIDYDLSFDIQVKSGYYNLNDKPKVQILADFEYKDAEVVVNSDMNIIEHTMAESDTKPIEIKNLPEELKMVKRIAMNQSEKSTISFFVDGLGKFNENIDVVITLPDYLYLGQSSDGSYAFNAAEHTLSTSLGTLLDGLDVKLEALDFGASGLEPDENGTIKLFFAPSIAVRMSDSSPVLISDLIPDQKLLHVKVGIEESTLSIESVSGKVDYSYAFDKSFELKGIGDIDLEIEGLGLKPVLQLNLTHPLTVPITLNGEITPMKDGEAVAQNAIRFDNVVLPAATYAGGDITPCQMQLIIADESLESQYPESEYKFVACDVTKLLSGTLPDEFNVSLSVGVDPSEVQTLYFDDSLAITYDYAIDLPVAIDNRFGISYKDEISDLKSQFKMLSEYDIKVGDITLIATIENTTPLEFGANVTLKDVNGNRTDAQVVFVDEFIVNGSRDGSSVATSEVRLLLDLGEDGLVSNIAEIDAVELSLMASSATGETPVAVNENQWVSAKLQLELAGGITIDVEKFMIDEIK